MTVTIDASVWVAARFPSEPGHAASSACLHHALGAREPIVLPWLAWVECAAAVARKTGDADLAREAGQRLRGLPAVDWVPLDETAAAAATALAATCGLRAADAIYAAVARQHDAVLVTLDAELRRRGTDMVRCVSPEEWTREHSS